MPLINGSIDVARGTQMATAVTYPKISKNMWWSLRNRLVKSIPGAISPTFISSIKPMSEASARSNVLAPLRELGLIDETNKPTELAKRWRHDDEYEAVCHEIRQQVYPAELIDAFPQGNEDDRESIKRWFMKVGHVGEAAARMYSGTYIMLSQANFASAGEETAKPASRSAASATKSPIKLKPTNPLRPNEDGQANSLQDAAEQRHRKMPALHIDVQVHISPDTAPEQIDRIFESMAKHLGNFLN